MGQLERLLSFMSEHGLEEFEYAHGDLRIRLKKAISPAPPATNWHALPGAPQPSAARPAPSGAPDLASSPVSPPSPASPAPEPPVAAEPAEELYIIKSPIVGTFFSAPNPESPPFIKVGEIVQAGQTVCIIEAMKLMNEIEAEIGGEVVRALVENGQPVEYGEPLFALRPASKQK